MKRFLILLSILFCNMVYADTININWMVDGQQYGNTTTCEYSGDVILPTPPTKYGYTFAGWEPDNYILLEYIESTGTQCIGNVYIFTNKISRVDIEFTQTTHLEGTPQFLFGTENSETPRCWEHVMQVAFNKHLWTYYIDNEVRYDYGIIATNQKYLLSSEYDGTKYIGTLDGVLKTTFSRSLINNTNSKPVSLFALARETTCTNPFIGRMYSCKIWDNNTLVRNLIPVKRILDNAVGMYDTVTGTFFGNAGTGTFIAGPVAN